MISKIRAALVTGATGFIGSALARRLARSGVGVTCLVRAGSARKGALAEVPGLTVIELPSFDPDPLRAALSRVPAEVVFHLASYGVQPNERDTEQMLLGNVTLMERLLGAVRDLPRKRFIYSGSCAEYGPVTEPERLTEAHPVAPLSPYGAAKEAAEVRGSALARELGVPFVPLRLFGVYGIGEAEHRLIPHLIAHLRRGEVPNLTGGEQARDLMYIDDVVEALVQAAIAEGIEIGTAYNVCTGEPVQIRAVAERVAAVMGKSGADLGLGRRPYRSDEAMWIVGDPALFRAATGWTPTVGLTEGIRRMVAASLSEAKP
jgi:UDP-glucose 4-epimerase